MQRELKDIERHLAACEPGSVAGQRLLSMRREIRREMNAKADDAPPPAASKPEADSQPPAPHRYKLGELCIVNGKQYSVTKVDDEGKALAGEPL
jgi:hypothetical protein